MRILTAFDALKAENVTLALNIKFLFEGEEQAGLAPPRRDHRSSYTIAAEPGPPQYWRPYCALDLSLKILIWEDAPGKVWVDQE